MHKTTKNETARPCQWSWLKILKDQEFLKDHSPPLLRPKPVSADPLNISSKAERNVSLHFASPRFLFETYATWTQRKCLHGNSSSLILHMTENHETSQDLREINTTLFEITSQNLENCEHRRTEWSDPACGVTLSIAPCFRSSTDLMCTKRRLKDSKVTTIKNS